MVVDLLRLFRRPPADTLTIAGVYTFTRRRAATGEMLSRHVYKNVACLPGKQFIAAWLNQEAGYGGNPTVFGAVGTSTATPQASDTQLGAEFARVVLASQSRAGNVLTWDFFFTTAQGNAGTNLREAGAFLGGSTVTGSGSLLSHVAINEGKDATETLTVEVVLTIGP